MKKMLDNVTVFLKWNYGHNLILFFFFLRLKEDITCSNLLQG